jgi:threonyl-tRNA synthetase
MVGAFPVTTSHSGGFGGTMETQENPTENDKLYRIRHSLAHIMAQAVLDIRPGSTLGFGPPIDDGFYYDFILSEPITEEDFPAIEKKMKHIIKQNQLFEREDLPRAEAMARLEEMGEPYKQEYANELFDNQGIENLTFYQNGPFLDMCEGPHVERSREIPAGCFKIRTVAGAYWRGDSDNIMMTRLYAWAFETREELDAHVKAYKEALARDHKKLGKELDFFTIDDTIGKGLPLWLPNGTIIRDELEKLAREKEFAAGYERVCTPHLTKVDLYYQTGHLPYYADSMYPVMELQEEQESEDGQTTQVVKEAYCLKPMNCPHHHRIFAARKRSYRDLPIRLAEYGQVYRFEDSGALSGLLRVRGMAMNDAHIYCTADQIKDEFLAVMDLHKELYGILGIEDFYMRFSTWDPDDPKGKEKYLDDPDGWAFSQRIVEEAMKDSGLPYVEGKGEAAFYGPKVDFQFRTVTGREETASTNQLDFGIAARMSLTYTDATDTPQHPYIIHRAPLGTHERFVAFLIEHYGGAFPTWLSPIQVRVVTVADRFNDYGQKIVDELRGHMVRAEIDTSNETMGKKVRTALTTKIPNILILGEREMDDETVTLRRYGQRDQETMSVAEFKERVLKAISGRTTDI